MKSSELHIAHECPQCGAPATLLESDRLFACGYCRVRSYLLTRGHAQYRLLPKGGDGRQMIYFPYWRFKGMLFSCLPQDIQARFIDTSHQACPTSRFPVSLGLRSQALTLGVVTTETPGYFIKPQAGIEDIMSLFNRRFNRNLTHPLLHQAHIGESVSLIYAPYYLAPGLVDAVLDHPLPQGGGSEFRLEAFPEDRPGTRFDFIPTLCPQCGRDIEGPSDAHVLACRYCRSLWQPGRDGFRAMPAAHWPTSDGEAVYLPFWRIRAEVDGAELVTYADLVRLANLPKAVQKAWEETPFYFWSPAFKVRPRVFLRLMQVLSSALPLEGLVRRPPDKTCQPANLPLSEAAETLKLNLAGFIKPLERRAMLLPTISVTPRRALLVYIPFQNRSHELISRPLNLAINKQQLSLASNL